MRAGSGRARFALLALATILACLGMPAGAGAAGWGPEIPIRDGLFTGPLATYVDDEGNTTVVTNGVLAGGAFSSLNVSVIEKGVPRNVFSTGFSELPGGIDDYFDAGGSVGSGIDEQGRTSVAWAECECFGASRLRAVAVDPGGRLINAEPLTIKTLPAETEILDLSYAVAPNGTAALSAVLEDDDGTWVEAYRIDRNQKTAVPITDPDTGVDAESTTVAINSAGQVYLTWKLKKGGLTYIRGQAYGPGGPIGPERDIMVSGVDYDLIESVGKVLLDARGIATVFFSGQAISDEDPADLGMAQVDVDTGDLLKPAYTLVATNGLPLVSGVAAGIALAPDGGIRVLYSQYIGATEAVEVRAYAIDKDGVVDDRGLVSDGSPTAALAALALRKDGSGTATYVSGDQPVAPSQYEIRLRQVNAGGEAVGPPETIGTSNEDAAELVAIFGGVKTAVSKDAAAVAWPAGLGDVLDIFTVLRIYDSRPPRIKIHAPKKVVAGEEVTFRATVDDANSVESTWTFSDGGTAAGELVTHTFAQPDRYTVTLRAVDSAGGEAVAQHQITVYADPDAARPVDPAARPDTRITRPPAIRLHRRHAAVRFRSTQRDATFECRVGRGPIAGSREARLRRVGKGGRGLVVRGKWRSCASPLRLRKLRPALYVVRVRAVGSNGLRDRTPAVTRFRVLRPAKKTGSARTRR